MVGYGAGDVGVEILPDAFDLVFIRAVRWKKVQLESLALLRRETESHLLRAVNRIVVQDHVNSFRPRVARDEFPKQVNKQQTAFPFFLHPSHPSGNQGLPPDAASRSVRCEYLFLLTANHPVPPDFRIQVNIHLVHIDRDFV